MQLFPVSKSEFYLVRGSNKEQTQPSTSVASAIFSVLEYVSHILAAKACTISTMSGLTRQRSDPSGLILLLRLKSGGVSSLSSGGFYQIYCHQQLHKLRESNAENINLKDIVLTLPPVCPVKHSVKQAKALLPK